MRRIFAAALLIVVLLAGCSKPDVTASSAKKSVNICAHNGYFISGYDIHDNKDGSYTITVTAEKDGAK